MQFATGANLGGGWGSTVSPEAAEAGSARLAFLAQCLLQSRGPRSREGVQTEAAMEMTQHHSEWGKPMMPTGCSAMEKTVWKPPAVTSHPFAPTGPDGFHFSPHTPRLPSRPCPAPSPFEGQGSRGKGGAQPSPECQR